MHTKVLSKDKTFQQTSSSVVRKVCSALAFFFLGYAVYSSFPSFSLIVGSSFFHRVGSFGCFFFFRCQSEEEPTRWKKKNATIEEDEEEVTVDQRFPEDVGSTKTSRKRQKNSTNREYFAEKYLSCLFIIYFFSLPFASIIFQYIFMFSFCSNCFFFF